MGRIRRFFAWLTANDLVLGVAMLLLAAYYVIQPGVFQGKASGDGWFGFQYLRAIFFEHTLDMKKIIPEYLPFFGSDKLTGRMPNRCPIGPVLVQWPFFFVGALVERLILLGPREWASALKIVNVGGSPVCAWFVGLASLGASLYGGRAVYLLTARRFGRGAARLGAWVALWATPIAWYSVTQPCYQHALAFGCVAVLVEHWDKTLGEMRLGRFALLGALGGLAMTMRAQEVLYLLFPVGELVLALRKERKRAVLAGLVLGGAALAVFSIQIAVWYYYTHRFGPAQVEPLRLGVPFLEVTLFSTRAGLFAWSPVAYVAAAGLVMGLLNRAQRAWIGAQAAVYAIEIYVVACAWVLTSGYAFGARRLSDGAIFLGVWAAALFAGLGTLGRRLVTGFVGFCIVLNVAAMELQRTRGVASSGAYARTASTYLEQAKAPQWAQRFFGKVGYPFVQPIGWLFAARYGTSLSAFEGIVGNFMLDRDGQWMAIQTRNLKLDDLARSHVVSGLEIPRKTGKPAAVTGPVRMLLSMFMREKIAVQIRGTLGPGNLVVDWQGFHVVPERNAHGARFVVPAEHVKPGINDVRMTLPVGSTVEFLDFAPER